MDVPVSLGTCLCVCVYVCLGVCVLTEVQMHEQTGACVYSCMWGTCLCSCTCRRTGTCVCMYRCAFLPFLPANRPTSHQTCWCPCKPAKQKTEVLPTSSKLDLCVLHGLVPSRRGFRLPSLWIITSSHLHNTWSLQPKSLGMWSKLSLWGFYYFPFIQSCFWSLWRLSVHVFLVREDQVSASLDFMMLRNSRMKETADLQILS